MVFECYNLGMKVSNKSEILDILNKNKLRLSDYGVKRIGLFGSFVRGEQEDGSDVDLLVKFDQKKKNYHNFIGLIGLMEGLLDRKVDLVTEESLSPYIGPYIKKEVEYV